MSSYIARIGKNNVAFGMLWTLLPGIGRARSEIKQLAADHGATEYVSLPQEGTQPLIALLPEAAYLEKGAVRSSASSAAALLSSAFRGEIDNAVFGIQLSKSKAAFIGFRKGYPLIGFDRVVSIEQVDKTTGERVTSLEQLEKVTGEFLQEIGEMSQVAFYATAGLFPGRAVETVQRDWFGMVPEKKHLTIAKVRRAKSRHVMWALIALLLVGGYMGWDQYDAMQKEKALQSRKVVRHDPNEAYTKAATELLSKTGVPATFAAAEIIGKLNILPVLHQGWRLISASCKPGNCVLSWANEDGGTFRSFAASPLPGVPVFKTDYKEGLKGLQTSFDYQTTAPVGVKLNEVPNEEKFLLGFGSTIQEMESAGMKLDLGKPVVIALGGMDPNAIKEKVMEGNWKLSGDWAFYSALTTLPGNLVIETLDLAVSDNGMAMNISGKYYVKN